MIHRDLVWGSSRTGPRPVFLLVGTIFFSKTPANEALLEKIAKIAGIHCRSAIAQATRYKPGDFLTRHQDTVTKEKRKVAFVINLPPRWHPDWGGLLQFYEANGTPRDAWNPDFNCLSLFDVAHVHSVTSISHFAPEARLAVSGWFQLG